MKYHYTHPYLLNPAHKITVSLIGIGGTGSQVLTRLAMLNEALMALGHPGLHVTAYDGDDVSEANIGRQLYSPADLGINKAVCAVSRINRFYGYEWEAEPVMFTEEGCTNIFITCVDSAAARVKICKRISGQGTSYNPTEKRYYWMDFGNGQKTGQVVLGTCCTIKQPKSEFTTTSTIKTVVRLFPELRTIKEENQGPSCSLLEAINNQDLFINPTMADVGMNILWKLFREARLSYHGCYVNLDTMSVNPIML